MAKKVRYDPTVEQLPTRPDELMEFVSGIPDDGQRRLGIAIAQLANQMFALELRIEAAGINADTALANCDALQVEVKELVKQVKGKAPLPGPDASG